MTVTEIKQEATQLDPKEQKELVSYLLHIQQSGDKSYISKITREVDDNDKDNWVNYDSVRSKLLG